MRTAAFVFVLGACSCACGDDVRVLPPVYVSTPVVSARQWTTALTPTATGGWDFICQSYEYPTDLPTEWLVIHLETGVIQKTLGPNRVFTNSNYLVPSVGLTTENTQVRAPNDRVFFPQKSGRIGVDVGDEHYLNVGYFDPADRQIHQIPSVLDPNGYRHSVIQSAIFDHAGATAYFGSVAVLGDQPVVLKLNPVTLALSVIATVGVASSSQVKYAYYLAKDETNNWLYVAVGQEKWELVRVDVNTGATTVLYTTAGVGRQFMQFDALAQGWRVLIIENDVLTYYWIADGALAAYPGSGAPPGGARTVTPYVNSLATAPQIDWSRGIGHLLWRPNGSTGAWTTIEYDVTYRSPVTLESLATLPNGDVIGNAQSYNGFFKYTARTGVTDWFGNWPLGVSAPAIAVVSDSVVYIAGYPSGRLLRYDPTQTWAPDGTIAGNPSALGGFGVGVRYPYYLFKSTTNRLYSAGRQERDSGGSGIAYYDITAGTFSAVTSTGLDYFVPRGFVLLESIGLLVYSGEVISGSPVAEAKLITYSLDLVEQQRFTVQSGLLNTGEVFATSTPGVVVGITNDAPYLLYRFNVLTGTLLASVSLTGPVGPVVARGSELWAFVGGELVRIDTDTLVVEVQNNPTFNIDFLAWSARALYALNENSLYAFGATRPVQRVYIDGEFQLSFNRGSTTRISER